MHLCSMLHRNKDTATCNALSLQSIFLLFLLIHPLPPSTSPSSLSCSFSSSTWSSSSSSSSSYLGPAGWSLIFPGQSALPHWPEQEGTIKTETKVTIYYICKGGRWEKKREKLDAFLSQLLNSNICRTICSVALRVKIKSWPREERMR